MVDRSPGKNVCFGWRREGIRGRSGEDGEEGQILKGEREEGARKEIGKELGVPVMMRMRMRRRRRRRMVMKMMMTMMMMMMMMMIA